MTDKIVPGKFVSLTYVIRDDSGDVVEHNDIPVGYVYGGETELLGGMDAMLEGKQVGDKVTGEVSAEQGFGERNPGLEFTDDLDKVPEEYQQVGAEIEMRNEHDETHLFYVTKIEGDKITIDGNHPLAGKSLHLTVTVHEVRDATEEDMANTAEDASNDTDSDTGKQATKSPTLN